MKPLKSSQPNPDNRRHAISNDLHNKTVGFASSPVAGELRPPTNAEQWTLHFYESHVHSCTACHSPSKALQHQQPKGTRTHCSAGQELARQVTALFYRHDGAIYSWASTPDTIVRVEIPSRYTSCRSLLKAVARGAHPGACTPAQKHHVRIHQHDPSPLPHKLHSAKRTGVEHQHEHSHHGRKHKHKHGQVVIVDWPGYLSDRHAVGTPAAHEYHVNDKENSRSREKKKKENNNKNNSNSDDAYSTCAVVGSRGYSFAHGAKPIGSAPATTTKHQSYSVKPHRGSLYLGDIMPSHCADPCCRLAVREPSWDRRHSLWSTSYYI